jgi:hypothetical protein
MSRGNRGDSIYLDEKGHQTFIDTLEEACTKPGWLVHALTPRKGARRASPSLKSAVSLYECRFDGEPLSSVIGDAGGESGGGYEVVARDVYAAVRNVE